MWRMVDRFGLQYLSSITLVAMAVFNHQKSELQKVKFCKTGMLSRK